MVPQMREGLFKNIALLDSQTVELVACKRYLMDSTTIKHVFLL